MRGLGLLVTQRDNGIQRSCPARGQETRNQCGKRQPHNDHHVRARIGHRDAIEQRGKVAVKTNAPATPASDPAATITAPSFITNASTDPGVAPRAMRTPISWLRCATENASTPYTPTMAIRSAMAAKVASSTVLKRGLAVACPISSFRVSILAKTPGWSARN